MTIPDPGPVDRARLERLALAAAGRGSLLFHCDLAAALALAHVERGGRSAPAFDAWIVDVGPNGYETLFLDGRSEAYAVTFAANGQSIGEPRRGSASPRVTAMAAAWRTARASGLIPANTPNEVIVVPPPRDYAPTDPIEAYLICSSEQPGDLVLGRHWRLSIDDGGRAIAEATPLSRTVLVIPGANGRPPEDVIVTHAGEAPSEFHVYLTLKHCVEIEVVAVGSDTRWQISGETVRMIADQFLYC